MGEGTVGYREPMVSDSAHAWSDRVVRVEARSGVRRRESSGFLVAPDLVLTAGHAVPAGAVCTVGLPGGIRTAAETVWRGRPPSDAALLRLTGGTASPDSVLTWALITGGDPLGGRVSGYPAVAEGALEVLAVHVWPQDATRGERLCVDVAGPRPRDAGSTVWHGMSGAAVLDGKDRLIGVVVAEARAWGPGRLMAVPTGLLLGDPGFRALVGDPATARIGDACGIIRTGRPRLRWGADDVSESEPLKAVYAEVPFVDLGRSGLLAELDDWCRSGPPLAVRVLTGGAGTGKSRLAIELCDRLTEDGWHAGLAVAPAGPDWGGWSPRRPTLVVFDYADDRRWTRPFRALFQRCREQAAESLLPVPVRILLVARREGQWIEDLDRSGNAALTTMLGRPSNRALELSSTAFTPEVRRAHLSAAFRRFTALAGAPGTAEPGVTGSADDHPQVRELYEERLGASLKTLLKAVDAEPGVLADLLRTRLPQLVTAAVSRLVNRWDAGPVVDLTAALRECLGDGAVAAAAVGASLPTGLTNRDRLLADLEAVLAQHRSVAEAGRYTESLRRELQVSRIPSWIADAVDSGTALLGADTADRARMARAAMLVGRLIGIGVRLDASDGGDGALAVLRTAVEGGRWLRGADGHDAYGRALESFGLALTHAGRYDEAFAVTTEYVRLMRDLARLGPLRSARLARALNIHAVACLSAGREPEGRAALREAAALLPAHDVIRLPPD